MGNVDIDRIKQESANLEAMGASGSPTTPNGTPLLERLLQLEQHVCRLHLLAGLVKQMYKQNLKDEATFTSFLNVDAYGPGHNAGATDVKTKGCEFNLFRNCIREFDKTPIISKPLIDLESLWIF